MKQFLLIAGLSVLGICAQAQTASRLTGSSFYPHNGTSFYLHDTSYYQYSRNRGGDLESPYIAFDNQVIYTYDTTTKALTAYNRYIQSFDARNKRMGMTQLYWDKTIGAWDYNANTLFTYDIADNITIDDRQKWNKAGSYWDNTMRYSYSFDSKRNKTMDLTEIWESGSWVKTDQFLYAYTASDSLTEKIYRQWDATAGAWTNMTLDSFYYNGSGKRSEYLQYRWDNTLLQWVLLGKTTYDYDGRNFLAKEDLKTYDAGIYNNFQLLSYSNDASGNVLENTLQNWNDTTAVYDNLLRKTATYDARNNQLSFITAGWDKTGARWENSTLTSRTFDIEDNLLAEVGSDWNHTALAWDSSERNDYTYNTYNQLTSDISAVWNASAGAWYNSFIDRKFVYQYEEYTPTSIPEAAMAGTMNVYPVPARDYLDLDIRLPEQQSFDLKLYSLDGRLLRQWHVAAASSFRERISVQELPAGQYVLDMQNNKGERLQQKITVQH